MVRLMITIAKENLIKDLIKEDYYLPLSKIEEVDFILTKSQCKTIEDCKKVHEYIEWYTETTIKGGHNGWDNKLSVQMLYDYYKAFDGMEYEIFPKRDMYNLIELMREIKYQSKLELKKIMKEKVIEEYDKGSIYRTWDYVIKEENCNL